MTTPAELLRRLPQTDELLRAAAAARPHLPRGHLKRAAREVLARLREEVRTGRRTEIPPLADLAASVVAGAAATRRLCQCRVINATGVVLHTNLGRAVLPAAALRALQTELRGYSLLEADRASGRRSRRDDLVRELLCELSGAEDATVVNNNAAATHIILNTLAEGKEVVCSHAHLVGIGGSFRMPDCMLRAGVTLRPVGATNHCLVQDYEGAIHERTGLLLVVHTSNYRIVGFTRYASLEEVVALGRRHGIPVVYDLGSATFVDTARLGHGTHGVRQILDAGVDLVCFSGDKLLGGPQAGLVLGRRRWVEAIRRNPFYRLMRPDKVTLALLEATLRLYLDPEEALREVPVLGMIRRDRAELRRRAGRLLRRLRRAGLPARLRLEETESAIGGGSLTGESLPTVCVVVEPEEKDVATVAARLRAGDPCVFARIHDGRLYLDPRTLLPGEEPELAAALAEALRA